MLLSSRAKVEHSQIMVASIHSESKTASQVPARGIVSGGPSDNTHEVSPVDILAFRGGR